LDEPFFLEISGGVDKGPATWCEADARRDQLLYLKEIGRRPTACRKRLLLECSKRIGDRGPIG